MKKIKPRVYLLIETKKREFDARIYFALKASLKNYSVVFAAKPKIFDNRKRMKKGIIIFKSIGKRNYKYILEYKKLGFIVGSLDEEGMNFFSGEEYLDRIHSPTMELLDIFFCWGKKDYNVIVNKFPEYKDKIFIIGNSRIDILKKPINQIYLKTAEKIKKKYGEFILVNTMFTKANNGLIAMRGSNYINELIKDGLSHESVKVKLAKFYLEFQRKNLESLKNFILNYSNNFPEKKIIIRPHPGEYSKMWFDFTKNLKNVETIIDDDSTNSWIIASNKCITSNCTTSLEGYLLDKITANYIVYKDEKVEFSIPKITSKNIRKDSELIDFLDNKVEYNLDKNLINNTIKDSIHNFGNDDCNFENFYECISRNKNITKKLTEFDNSKDKFSGKFYSLFFNLYYYIRFYYRNIFTKQDKMMGVLLKKKFDKIKKGEVENTLNLYKNYLNISEKIKVKEIYPQVYEVTKEK